MCPRQTALGLLILSFALGTAHSARGQEIAWRNDYNRARQEASEKGRPLLLDFYTDNCFYCKMLDQKTFRDPEVLALLSDRFVTLKVDAGRSPDLAEKLNIRLYPTLVFAGADGRILGYQEGFVEAPKMKELLLKVLAATAVPEWMARDYQEAVRLHTASDYAKTVSLLRNILEDGKDRPVQVKARQLLADLEAQAGAKMAQARQLVERNQIGPAGELLTEVVRVYPGTPAARDAAVLLQTLAARSDGDGRAKRAAQLLTQAKDDLKAQQYLCCLDRCETLLAQFTDLPEANEARRLSDEIRANPDWTRQACDQTAERLCLLYLGLAESYQKKGQATQAAYYLERVGQVMPGSRYAEIAQGRLAQIQSPTGGAPRTPDAKR